MPKFTTALQETLHRAVAVAKSRKHEYATLEHLLVALLDDKDASAALTGCGADMAELRQTVETYLDECKELRLEKEPDDVFPTSSFQRIVQRAILHVQSQGREEVTGSDVLIAIYTERESYAVYFLQQQDISRLDLFNFQSHCVEKPSREERERQEQEAITKASFNQWSRYLPDELRNRFTEKFNAVSLDEVTSDADWKAEVRQTFVNYAERKLANG